MKAPLALSLLLAANLSLLAAPGGSGEPLMPFETQLIAAAQPAVAPQFNGPFIVGVRPGTPLVYALAVTGEAPLNYSVRRLPAGLTLEPKTGVISGALSAAGTYQFEATAKNTHGKASAKITLVVGDTLALTPPLGWNSYDAFGDSVTEAETLANADWFKQHLQPAGWDTIVIDFRWYDPQPTGNDWLLNKTRVGAALAADEYGRLLPAPNRFPSAAKGGGFKALADRLHAQGLKFGIHVMRGIPRQAVLAKSPILGTSFTAADAANTGDKCSWCPDMFGVVSNAAGQAWYDSCAKLWSEWGVDYIKVDDLSQPYHTAEIEMVSRAIKQYGHSIVFSTSPGETPVNQGAHIAAQANLWRISGDFWDNWQKLDNQFKLFYRWRDIGGPGHWPDGDMIPLGHLSIRSGMGGKDHWTHFNRAEQLTLMSLWALTPSPLILGMNLPDNDDWTTALLTNPEVLAVNQDVAGHKAQHCDHVATTCEVWSKELADGSVAAGFFNRTKVPLTVQVPWSQLGFEKAPRVRDLWLRKDLPRSGTLDATIPPHSAILLQVTKARGWF